MNLDDRLNRDKKEQEKRRRTPDPDEEEETMLYDVRKPAPYLNRQDGGVFDLKRQEGINTRSAVFDRQAVFRTGQ